MSDERKCVWIRKRGEPCDEPESNPIHAPCDCEPHVHQWGEEQGFCHPFQPAAEAGEPQGEGRCKRAECEGFAAHDPEFHEAEFAPLFPEQFAELSRLRAELEAEREKAHRWETALVGLTVGGSEFAGDPDACVQYVAHHRRSQAEQICNLVRENRKERERAEAAERRAGRRHFGCQCGWGNTDARCEGASEEGNHD